MTRSYYAVSYLYGRGVTTTQRITYGAKGGPGERTIPAANLHRFKTPGEARAFAAGGSSYMRERDYRELLTQAPRGVQAWARREIRAVGPDGNHWIEVPGYAGEVLS